MTAALPGINEIRAVLDQGCPKQEWMPRLVSASPRLSKAGMPSRSEAGAVCSKSRSVLSDIREAHRLIRSASRPSIRCALRAIFEQTAPPSLREGTPPNLGGDWVTSLQPNQAYIASTTFKPYKALLCGSPSILSGQVMVIGRALPSKETLLTQQRSFSGQNDRFQTYCTPLESADLASGILSIDIESLSIDIKP